MAQVQSVDDADYYDNVVNRSVVVRNGFQQDFDGQEGALGSITAIASGLFGVSIAGKTFLTGIFQSVPPQPLLPLNQILILFMPEPVNTLLVE